MNDQNNESYYYFQVMKFSCKQDMFWLLEKNLEILIKSWCVYNEILPSEREKYVSSENSCYLLWDFFSLE